ncbi:hypothetical protein GCM10023082_30550 [Streptomyces tremellae]|uniref:MmyB-like transcription regulator ligand binding domain-containing protein n=1 Tax=Streptomyces tremellae TaxID=1124239 RepID=A0ABP7F934_9ACTN
MGGERFRHLWARADARARTHGRKAYRHPLVGVLEVHRENVAPPDESSTEPLPQSAAPGSPAEDGPRRLAGLGADSDDGHPTANAPVRERPNNAHPAPGTPRG